MVIKKKNYYPQHILYSFTTASTSSVINSDNLRVKQINFGYHNFDVYEMVLC